MTRAAASTEEKISVGSHILHYLTHEQNATHFILKKKKKKKKKNIDLL